MVFTWLSFTSEWHDRNVDVDVDGTFMLGYDIPVKALCAF